MSEPENPSTQEKIDAWFASLQLDKPAPLTKWKKFSMFLVRNKYLFYFLGLFLFPAILYYALFWVERKTNFFLLYGFTKSEWFLFSGSYFGGLATPFGI